MVEFGRTPLLGGFPFRICHPPQFAAAVFLLVKSSSLGFFPFPYSGFPLTTPDRECKSVLLQIFTAVLTCCLQTPLIRIARCHVRVGEAEESGTALFSIRQMRSTDKVYKGTFHNGLLLFGLDVSPVGFVVHHGLYFIPSQTVDDCDMMVFDIVARCFTTVL